MTAPVFEPILQDEVPNLIQILQKSMPYSTLAYNWLSVHWKWLRIVEDLELKVFCPEGDWKRGDVLAMAKGLVGEGRWSGMFYATTLECDQVTSTLVRSSCVPWSHVAHFTGVYFKHVAPLLEAFSQLELPKPHVIPCLMYHMTDQQATEIELPMVPAGMTVSRLSAEHVYDVCETWPHFSEPMRRLVSCMVCNNLSAGVFSAEGEMVASVLHTYYGGVGLLQTLPKYRGQGLASLALAYLTRELGRAGINPHLHIMLHRDEAEGLVRRLGYQPLAKYSRIVLM